MRVPKVNLKNILKPVVGLKAVTLKVAKFLRADIVIIVAIVAVFGTIYVTAQQVVRLGANDPQVQLAEDLVPNLSGGMDPANLLGGQKTELGRSLAPFLIVYDAESKVLTSSVELAGNVPIVPKGVLDVAKKEGRNITTWKPKEGLYLAIVVNYYKSPSSEGYIVVGRSLREVDKSLNKILTLVAMAGVVTLAVTLALRKITGQNCC